MQSVKCLIEYLVNCMTDALQKFFDLNMILWYRHSKVVFDE